MDTAIGIVGKDFVIVCTDCSILHSILKLKDYIPYLCLLYYCIYQDEADRVAAINRDTEDKIALLDQNKVMAMSGEQAYRLQFSDYISKNIALSKYRNGTELNTKECAQFVRSELAYGIRNGPFMVNCLIAGFDNNEPQLYWVDYMGTLVKSVKAAHGYAAHFVLSTLDHDYKPDLTQEEGIATIKRCIYELQTRFLVSQTRFIAKIVTADGVKVIEL